MNYIFLDIIGRGSFGEVYLAQKTNSTNKKVAVKIENKNKNNTSGKRLLLEYKIYKYLRKSGFCIGIPKVYRFMETQDGYYMLVMQLLKKNVDDLFTECDRKFSIGSVFKFGIDITRLLQSLHNCGFIHRDIKPSNFMFGYDNELYMMDLGLSKRYLTKSGKHIELKYDNSFIGTARFASNNVHYGLEPSRRDDLESVGYMLIFFTKGSLPWQGLKKKKNERQIDIIGNKKLTTSKPEILCEGLPICLKKYLAYCRSLKFDETPNYEYLINLFIDDAKKLNIKIEYDF